MEGDKIMGLLYFCYTCSYLLCS